MADLFRLPHSFCWLVVGIAFVWTLITPVDSLKCYVCDECTSKGKEVTCPTVPISNTKVMCARAEVDGKIHRGCHTSRRLRTNKCYPSEEIAKSVQEIIDAQMEEAQKQWEEEDKKWEEEFKKRGEEFEKRRQEMMKDFPLHTDEAAARSGQSFQVCLCDSDLCNGSETSKKNVASQASTSKTLQFALLWNVAKFLLFQ